MLNPNRNVTPTLSVILTISVTVSIWKWKITLTLTLTLGDPPSRCIWGEAYLFYVLQLQRSCEQSWWTWRTGASYITSTSSIRVCYQGRREKGPSHHCGCGPQLRLNAPDSPPTNCQSYHVIAMSHVWIQFFLRLTIFGDSLSIFYCMMLNGADCRWSMEQNQWGKVSVVAL